MTRAFIALPDRDQRAGDFRGAFQPEADRFAQLYGAAPVLIDISQPDGERRRQLAAALSEAGRYGPLDLVALCCHGWKDGLQLGHHRLQAPQLAAAIASVAAPGAGVALYACSTADAEEDPGAGTCGAANAGTCGAASAGFADVLYQCLRLCVLPDGSPGTSLHVDAHTCAGHCTSNPFVMRIEERGAAWLVAPDSALWQPWKAQLLDRHGSSTLRLRYPVLSREQLAAELGNR